MVSDLVLITGGSFQGKSLVSMQVASNLHYSTVICTDLFRNILNVQKAGILSLSTSPYKLDKADWLVQKIMICDLLKEVLPIYFSRGEKIVVEGVHFTEEFLIWTRDQGGIIFCIDNQLPFSERIKKKLITRSKLDGFDENDQFWVEKSSYYKYRHRMGEMHQEILDICSRLSAEILKITCLPDAVKHIESVLVQT